MKHKVRKTKILNRGRLMLLFVCINLGLTGLLFRVAYLQFVADDDFKRIAVNWQVKDRTIEPKRGEILDRNENKLAASRTLFTIWAEPQRVAGKRKAKSAEEKVRQEENLKNRSLKLAKILGKQRTEIVKGLRSKKRIVKIADGVERTVAGELAQAEIPGISMEESSKRVYPNKNFMSHTLGSVTSDNTGVSGLELYYERQLRGIPGRLQKSTDLKGTDILSKAKKDIPAVDGNTIVLTVDSTIQKFLEESVRKSLRKLKAVRVSCMVMDTKRGEILGLASTPGFDPNDSRQPSGREEKAKFSRMSQKKRFEYLNKMWRNPLINDTYEPGSTAKLVTTAANIEEGLTKKTDSFYCGGYRNVLGHKIKCWSWQKPHGAQTLYKAVGNSCNPAFIELGLRLGKKRYYEYLKLFGLHEKTDIDYPGEASSIILNEKAATRLDLATMAFGQTNAVTAVQLVTAISAIGNDGYLMKPYLVKEIRNREGKVVKKNKPTIVRQAISKSTSHEMRDIMRYVVEKGGGKQAYLEGYDIGGKTGTAQKIGKGGYSDEVIASFIGMAPMNNPEITMLYLIDSPAGGQHGGTIAAPEAKALIKKIIDYRDTE